MPLYANPMNKKPIQKLGKRMIVLRVVICVISIPIGAFVFLWVLASLFLQPGRFNRDRMNAIVDVVRQQQIDSEMGSAFQIDDFSNPKAIRAVTSGPGNVWAQRTTDGVLSVSIMTRECGHFADYGFAYSDIPLNPKTIDGKVFLYGITQRGQEVSTPGRIDWPWERIDEHWWKVYDPTR